MSVAGRIVPEYTVWCALCGTWERLAVYTLAGDVVLEVERARRAKTAAAWARRLGWSKRRGVGWVCPAERRGPA